MLVTLHHNDVILCHTHSHEYPGAHVHTAAAMRGGDTISISETETGHSMR